MKFVIVLIASLMLVSCSKKPTNTIENASAQTSVEQQHKIVIEQLDYTCTLGNCITKYCIDGYEYLAFNGKDLTQVFYGQTSSSKPRYCGG